MAELILDLSGRKGLADDFFGDADTITPRPELRLASGQGELVSGLFNPYLRTGYLAPTTSSVTALTIDTPSDSQLTSVEYDHDSGYMFWADRGNSIYQSTSLTDTSISLLDSINDVDFSGIGFESIHDLQIYQINGEQKLFAVGKGVATGDSPLINVAGASDTGIYLSLGISVAPFSATKPTIVAYDRNFTAGSGTTTTESFTVPVGTNQALFVIAFSGGTAGPPSATWNGASMVFVSGNTTSLGGRIFALANPTAATGNVVVTWGSSQSNRLVYIVLVNNAHQGDVLTGDWTLDPSPNTTDINAIIDFTDKNALNMVAVYSSEVISPSADSGTLYYDQTNSYGSELLAERNETGYGLQVGYGTDFPPSSFGGQKASWLSSIATNGFLQDLNTDYAFMRNADNGFAYIFADNHVHKIDGTITGGEDGTVTKDVLLFPEYFRLTDAVDYRSRLYMAVHQYPVSVADTSLNTFTGKCGIYVWNRISTQLTNADYIELPGVREIKKIFASPDGQLKLITISDSGLTELRQFGYNDSGGVVFPVQKLLGIGAYPQFPDGLSTAGDKVVWLANDGKIYCNKESAVTQLFQAKAPGVTTDTLEANISSGAIFYGSGNETASNGFRSNKQAITHSYLDGSTHVIQKVYPFDLSNGGNTAQTPHTGTVYTAVNYIPVTSVVRNVRIYNAPITGSGSTVVATIKLFFNQGTSAVSPYGMTKTITKDEAKRGYVDFKVHQPYIHAIQMSIDWSTSVTMGADMYLPSAAVITYDETKVQSPDNG